MGQRQEQAMPLRLVLPVYFAHFLLQLDQQWGPRLFSPMEGKLRLKRGFKSDKINTQWPTQEYVFTEEQEIPQVQGKRAWASWRDESGE